MWVQQSSTLRGAVQLIVTLESPLNRPVKNGLQAFLRRILIDMVVANRVCKCEKQHWPLQKFSLLFELPLVFYSGHDIALIAVGYTGCRWALCVAVEICKRPRLSQPCEDGGGRLEGQQGWHWVKISLALIKQTHMGQCHDLPSISFPKTVSLFMLGGDHSYRHQLQIHLGWFLPSRQSAWNLWLLLGV